MKTSITIMFSVLFLSCRLFAQAPPAIEDQLTALWKQSNYAELNALLQAKISAAQPDVVALYCAKFFYVFVQPDKAKAVEAATKLKAYAEASMNAEFIALAVNEIAEIQAIPDSAYTQPTAALLAFYHSRFANLYPTVRQGVGLRNFKAP